MLGFCDPTGVMDFFEIALFVLGAAFFIVSFFIREKNEQELTEGVQLPSKDEIDAVEKKVRDTISSASDQAVGEAEDRLSKLSNETIISVEDYSKQTLERIAHNHEEVVFMYHMLQTKEEELKKLMAQPIRTVEEPRTFTASTASMDELPQLPPLPETSGIEIARRKAQTNSKNRSAGEAAKSRVAATTTADTVENITKKTVMTTKNADDSNQTDSEEERNRNRMILELYHQKKSVLEISKQLGLGQGEVKLVIDLYGSGK